MHTTACDHYQPTNKEQHIVAGAGKRLLNRKNCHSPTAQIQREWSKASGSIRVLQETARQQKSSETPLPRSAPARQQNTTSRNTKKYERMCPPAILSSSSSGTRRRQQKVERCQRHPVFPSGPPSKYYLGSSAFNFSDRTRTGVFALI